MSIPLEILVLQAIVIGGCVIAVQGRRLGRLEKVPRSPLSAQIGALQDQIRVLQAEHDHAVARDERRLDELSVATDHLERDVEALAQEVAELPSAVADRLGSPWRSPAAGPADGPTWIPTTGRPSTIDRKAG